jgi:hypothetical protein
MTRQARFGGILDHGHEAAVYRNENKPLAIIRQLTFVAEYHPKQYQRCFQYVSQKTLGGREELVYSAGVQYVRE